MSEEIKQEEQEQEPIIEDEIIPDPSLPNIQIKDIDGVGPSTVTKLKKAGITSIFDLATCSADELADILNSKRETTVTLIADAHEKLQQSNYLDHALISSDKLYEKRQNNIKRLTTSSDELNILLKGGFETEAITEIYGEFGSGKSQLCFMAAINTPLAEKDGGLNGTTIYLDSENMYRPERIKEICDAKGLDTKKHQKAIKVLKVFNASMLEINLRLLPNYIEKFNVKLLVLDSLVGQHRAEFIGRGTLADRQQRLNKILHKLKRIAEIYHIVVLLTNQVTTSPDSFFGDPTKAVGGNVVAHNTTYRIYLKKSSQNRIARMVDSSYHPQEECRFTIMEEGITDIKK